MKAQPRSCGTLWDKSRENWICTQSVLTPEHTIDLYCPLVFLPNLLQLSPPCLSLLYTMLHLEKQMLRAKESHPLGERAPVPVSCLHLLTEYLDMLPCRFFFKHQQPRVPSEGNAATSSVMHVLSSIYISKARFSKPPQEATATRTHFLYLDHRVQLSGQEGHVPLILPDPLEKGYHRGASQQAVG